LYIVGVLLTFILSFAIKMAKILILDDSKEQLELFILILKKYGYHINTVTSEYQLKDTLLYYIPDLLIIDVRLRGADGREICKYLRSTSFAKDIPIFITSSDPELLKNYPEWGATDKIEKPFNVESMISKINSALSN